MHDAAVARSEAAAGALATLREVVSRVAAGVDEEAWGALRALARAALRAAGDAAVAGDVVTAWACDFCGRVEAPQPCIGVCIKPEITMVDADEHLTVLARDAAVRAEIARLAPLAHRVAWSTPRPGAFDRHVAALAAQASTLKASF